jgi:hypothetical protein
MKHTTTYTPTTYDITVVTVMLGSLVRSIAFRNDSDADIAITTAQRGFPIVEKNRACHTVSMSTAYDFLRTSDLELAHLMLAYRKEQSIAGRSW